MKIHEYQAKAIFAKYGIPVTKEILCRSVDEVVAASEKLNFPCVVKAQVLTGGRGKAGGVKLVKSTDEAREAAKNIIGMDIKGCKVEKVLVAEGIQFHSEIYVGLTIDRNSKSVVLLTSKSGGMVIE